VPIIEQFDCPYCMTKSAGFQAVGSFRRTATTRRRGAGQQAERVYEDWFMMSCGNCRKCIVAHYNYQRVSEFKLDNIMHAHGSMAQFGYSLGGYVPKIAVIEEPDFLPERVAIPFRQAVSNVSASNWDAAGTMARKTLEVATKDLCRNKVADEEMQEKLIKKTWLKGRIARLFDLGILTRDLADLAGLIKDEGDEAAHEEEPYSENEARELVGYAQVLLTYVYSIPGMVKAVREQSAVVETVLSTVEA
jgi:hypothetical protein